MASDSQFTYDVEYSELDPAEALDSRGTKVTTLKCHGRLVAETRGQIEAIFKEIPFKGHIYLDLSDVSYVDSAGLGALIRLKLSAAKEGGVSVKYIDIGPRLKQLLSIASLTEWFSS